MLHFTVFIFATPLRCQLRRCHIFAHAFDIFIDAAFALRLLRRLSLPSRFHAASRRQTPMPPIFSLLRLSALFLRITIITLFANIALSSLSLPACFHAL